MLIPLNAVHLARTCPSLPPAATIAATAAITSARSCLYHSFSSVPPLPFLRVQSTLHLSSSLVLLITPQFQAQPPFHDDPNTPSIPLRCMSPWAAARTHDLLILLAATSLPHNTNMHCIPRLTHTTGQQSPHNTRKQDDMGTMHPEMYNSILKCRMAMAHMAFCNAQCHNAFQENWDSSVQKGVTCPLIWHEICGKPNV